MVSSPYWARSRRVGEWIARALPVRKPPLLILSLPRSGSSWVGTILGTSPDALYLHEPLNQVHLAYIEGPSVFPIESSEPPATYRVALDRVRTALPHFPEGEHIVRDRRPWRLWGRRGRRLVLKEVNPQALEWLLRELEPRVLYLVRHPAAVAASHRRLHYFRPVSLADWREEGAFQGRMLREVRDRLARGVPHQVARYEDLCRRPLDEFWRLFAFAELRMDVRTQDRIRRWSKGGSRAEAYSTWRHSQSMVTAWRSELHPCEVEALREGYLAQDPPWYGETDADGPDLWAAEPTIGGVP